MPAESVITHSHHTAQQAHRVREERGELLLCVSLCVCEFMHGCSICMHYVDSISLHAYDIHLLTCSYVCLVMFLHVQTLVPVLMKPVVMLADIFCTVSQGRADHLTLKAHLVSVIIE